MERKKEGQKQRRMKTNKEKPRGRGAGMRTSAGKEKEDSGWRGTRRGVEGRTGMRGKAKKETR